MSEFTSVGLHKTRKLSDAIYRLRSREENTAELHREFLPGEVLLAEGEPCPNVFLVIEGAVQLTTREPDGAITPVGVLHEGDFVGLFPSYGPDFAPVGAHALTRVTTLCFPKSDNDLLLDRPELAQSFGPLVLERFAAHYKEMIELRQKVAHLAEQVDGERMRSLTLDEELQRTRTRLVSKEKMSSLGQLVAGIAHELNNPVAALLGSLRTLRDQIAHVVKGAAHPREAETELQLFSLGMTSTPLTSARQHERIDALAARYPKATRTMLRLVAELGDDGVTLCEKELTSKSSRAEEMLRSKVRYFELGTYLRGIQVSGERISNLIKGLKSYARPPVDRFEAIDLRDGIRDTVVILGNRLRNVDVRLDLPAIPAVRCIAGEMHQVWTNILSNACDAIDGNGSIAVACHADTDSVHVTLTDSGPGIPDEIAGEIFKPNFTTKTSSGNFGLGLGLSIARDIVVRHGGTISCTNAPEGGARFTITLPVSNGTSEANTTP